jgi:hypothetical protein
MSVIDGSDSAFSSGGQASAYLVADFAECVGAFTFLFAR